MKDKPVQRAIDGPNFLPRQMYEDDIFTPYFFPSGYVITGQVALNMAMMPKLKAYVPDGVYIGILLQKLGFDVAAGNDPFVCLGTLHGHHNYLNEISPTFLTNPCFISGLCIIDGVPETELTKVYQSLSVCIFIMILQM